MSAAPKPAHPDRESTALCTAPAAGSAVAPPSASDRRLTRQFIAVHSKSFYLSSLLLPRATRQEAWALYAFCRQADDSVDGVNPGDGTVPIDAPADTAAMLEQVTRLRQRLDRVYAGELAAGEAHAIDRAFRAVVVRTGLPQAVPQRLLSGMEMDARGVSYGSWEELLGYCFNVAATVGLMMTYVMGHCMQPSRRSEVLLRACDLGVAMQLSNIARDVGEDARRGRVYLPDELLRAHGLDAAQVLALGRQTGQPPPAALRDVVRALVQRADSHYRAAALGVTMLPKESRLAIRSALLIYSGLGARLKAQGYDALTRRAYVPLGGKLLRVLRAWAAGFVPRNSLPPTTQGPADELLTSLCQEVGVL